MSRAHNAVGPVNGVGRRLVVGVQCLLLIVWPPPVMGEDSQQVAATDMRDVLSAAYSQWQQDVVFTSTFVYDEVSSSHEPFPFGEEVPEEVWEALLNPSEKLEVRLSADGVFHKTSELMRYRFDCGSDPTSVSPLGANRPQAVSGGQYGNLSNDEVANSVARISYLFPQPETEVPIFDLLRFVRYDDTKTPETFLDRSKLVATKLHPLNLMVNSKGHPLVLWGTSDDDESKETVELITLADDRLMICMERTDSPNPQRRWVTFWMNPAVPVVERIQAWYFQENGDLYLQKDLRCSNFVKCPGGMVPKTVVSASFDPTGTAMAKRWRSEDLGDRSPTDDDFLLTTRASTTFYGVTNLPPVVNGRRRVDLTVLARQGYTETQAPLVQLPIIAKMPPEERPHKQWLFALFFITVACIAGLLIWRSRLHD